MANRTVSESRFAITSGTQKSMSFNGSSDYATFPITPATTGFCFGLWLRMDTLVHAMRILDYQDGGPAKGFTLMYDTNSPKKMSFKINDGSERGAISTPFRLGEWVHIVGTYKAESDSDFQIYLNTVVGTKAGALTTMLVPAQTVTIMRRSNGATNFTDGQIKNLTFQNTTTPWTAAQIAALYYRNEIPSGAKQWSMNDVATDQNGENALTLTGTSYSTDVPGHMTPRSVAGARTVAGTRTSV